MDEKLQENASAYALGIMPKDERDAFEKTLASNAEARDLVREFIDALGENAQDLPKIEPSDTVRENILREIDLQKEDRPKEAPRGDVVQYPIWIPWSIAAGFAIGASWLFFDRQSFQQEKTHLTQQLSQTQSAANELRDERTRLAVQIQSLKDDLAIAQNAANVAEMRVARLEVQQADQADAVAVSLWNDVTQEGILVVENLRLPPPGKTYQLWVIDPSTQAPIDAGIFTTDPDGRGRIVFRPKAEVKTAAQFAVSLENEGGVPAPQGPIVMIGPADKI